MKLVPMNALGRHVAAITRELAAVNDDVVRRGFYVLGPEVGGFEAAFANYCSVEHCVGVGNGTDALELGLRALGVSQASRVGVVANAAMYGATAVLACGAEPVFVDIDPSTHTMAPRALELCLASSKLDAVIVTHLYGRLADMQAIGPIAGRYGVPILEDCAQAHGACDADGHRAGSFGAAASFSFYPTKNLGAIGDGGAIVTNDPVIADRVRKLRQYGWSTKYRNELAGGRNSRLDELQAAFLRVMLPHLDDWNTRRREVANRYSHEIRNARIHVPDEAGAEYVAHLYVVEADDREGLRHHLTAAGIGNDVHYPLPDYLQQVFGARFADVHLAATEAACEHVLTLPCFPELTDEEISYVIKVCNQW